MVSEKLQTGVKETVSVLLKTMDVGGTGVQVFVGSIEAEELIVDIEVGGIDCVNVSDGEGKVKGL